MHAILSETHTTDFELHPDSAQEPQAPVCWLIFESKAASTRLPI